MEGADKTGRAEIRKWKRQETYSALPQQVFSPAGMRMHQHVSNCDVFKLQITTALLFRAVCLLPNKTAQQENGTSPRSPCPSEWMRKLSSMRSFCLLLKPECRNKHVQTRVTPILSNPRPRNWLEGRMFHESVRFIFTCLSEKKL